MYPKKYYFSFIFIETTHIIHAYYQSCKFADLSLHSDDYLKDTSLDGPNEDESCNKICTRKIKSCKTRRRSCVAVLSLSTRTMQVLIALPFYHSDKTCKTDRLIHASG